MKAITEEVLTPDEVQEIKAESNAQMSESTAISFAVEALRELAGTAPYCHTERWQRMFPGDKIPHQARLDSQRRDQILEAAKVLENMKWWNNAAEDTRPGGVKGA